MYLYIPHKQGINDQIVSQKRREIVGKARGRTHVKGKEEVQQRKRITSQGTCTAPKNQKGRRT